ncbi:MAG: cyanophycinase [Elusimicrobia bacterium]|nr:cyanophycinase [Elusimicrobiota bacterium]
MNTLFAVLCLWVAAIGPAHAGQRLVLFGGGGFPEAAVDRFMERAGGKDARILFVTWASGEPREEIDEFKDYLSPHKIPAMDIAPATTTIREKRAEFLAMLGRSSAVFFTGGDQSRIAEVLDRVQGLREAFKERYAAGVVFGGTSAGTAIMSEVMLTGEGDFSVIDGSTVGVRRGLGLLPAEMILDQHFIVRQRENRLFGLVLKNAGSLGLGVDEPCALVVDDGRWAQAFGPTYVMTAESSGRLKLSVGLLEDGARYDLKERKRL